ncbi:hypothetical protein J2S19_002415 [Metabacillus malikii]|uniref:Uncharacterized protein n=1 Tax=Metabacillus malikii TaxID=1504265 RepID=A0ABT9ZHY4_9BACI|nr:hypothetical protein [Metabacillus malikii]
MMHDKGLISPTNIVISILCFWGAGLLNIHVIFTACDEAINTNFVSQ